MGTRSTRGDMTPAGPRVAVIGIGCRLPGARDSHEFLLNLCRGVNSIREITPDRWDPDQFYSPDHEAPNRTVSKWCGLIDRPFAFDHAFFKISPKEARLMDPQQRLLLEETWRCIEDAGVGLGELQAHRTSVYVGVCGRDHLQRASAPDVPVESHSALGSFDCILANRLSQAFGLRGASLAIDAACASSLVAIDEGVRALHSGETDYVLAAGVNLDLHPWRYISYSKARMLSPDGQCKTFDKDANGFVPGEGVAVVLLRRLADAERDGAHVYGVIRGAAVNHGGQRLTITAPTVQSQRDVVRAALDQAGIDPRTITYVEAHGTGTSLGDPIEVEALTRAFRERTDDRQFCWIGSAKTNIGHLEGAAGIAGFLKVLMMMRSRKIPPTLNVRIPNPLINFADSPFRIARDLVDWKAARPGLPLRAGVSSFGFGGVNSHLIVEEHRVLGKPRSDRTKGPVPFVLSARTRQGLSALVAQWKTFSREEAFASLSLPDLCSTLSTGREQFAFRIGRFITDRNEIAGVLETDPLLIAAHGVRPWWLVIQDVALPPKSDLRGLLARAPFAEVMDELRREDERGGARLRAGGRSAADRCLFAAVLVRALARCGFTPHVVTCSGSGLWMGLAASGMLDWSTAAGLATTRKRSVPRLRRPDIPFCDPVTGRTVPPHRLDAPYFAALLRGLKIGRDEAARVMAKAQIIAASQHTFRNYIDEWNATLAARGQASWSVLLDGELRSCPDGDRRAAAVWALAIQNALDRLNHKWSLPSERLLDDPRVNELLDLLQDNVLSRDNVLALIAGDDGQHRDAAEEAQRQAHLVSPAKPYAVLRSTREPRELGDVRTWLARARAAGNGSLAAPSDAAVVCIGGGAEARAGRDVVAIDGSADSFGQFARLLMELWRRGVDIRWERWSAGRPHRKLSLPTCVFSGQEHRVAPEARSSTHHPVSDPAAPPLADFNGAGSLSSPAPERPQLWRLRARWSTEDVVERSGGAAGTTLVLEVPGQTASIGSSAKAALGKSGVHCVRAGAAYAEDPDGSFAVRVAKKDDYARMIEALLGRGALPSRIVHAWSLAPALTEGSGLEQRLQEGVYALFLLVQTLMERRPEGRVQILYLYPHIGGVARPEFAAVEGFAKSVRRENPFVSVRCVAIDDPSNGDSLWERVAREFRGSGEPTVVRYEGDRRLVKSYEDACTSPEPGVESAEPLTGIRPDGVYLVVGGAGGLGVEVARHLLKTRGVKVAIAGRSRIPERLERDLADFNVHGRLRYFQADVSDPQQVRALIQAVHTRFGTLSGVIHAAGVLRDSFTLRKTVGEFEAVLAPKVLGAVNLDEATAGEPLDFFVLFSSVVAITGNMGQADYAFANGFLDAFATTREQLRTRGARSGRTISINWPVWESGGMRVRENADTVLSLEQGFVPMPTAEGMAALDASLEGPAGDGAVLYGYRDRVERLFATPCAAEPETRTVSNKKPATDALHTATGHAITYLKKLFSELLEIPEAEIEPTLEFSESGMDSILINQFNVRIEQDLGGVSKTILFECRTLAEVASHLGRHRGEVLAAMMATAAPSAETRGASAPGEAEATPAMTAQDLKRNGAPALLDEDDDGGVAIIGMSGRYPMAANLEEFWRNLAAGRDCISEIPPERWDYRDRFAEDSEAAGDGVMYCKWGGFLEAVDRFDPLFFNIAPREAELMDPQERLFLEAAWCALEDAGYPPRRLSGSGDADRRAVGVFVGVTTYSYLLWGPDEWRKGSRAIPTSTPWSIPNRVSYWLDLRGPSMPVDTACASSLTALHLACQSLRKGECTMAIVGGVNLYLHPSKYEWLCQMQMLSRRGRCHAFGDAADGFVPGEGVGAMLLKPLRAALNDGDRILGVVKGTAVNHGGRTNGFTVPNPNAQAELVRSALRSARVDPRTIGYLEAHGTGTALGDPIEIAGLTKAFREEREENGNGDAGSMNARCAIGSVKTNIGHLESAAGLAGLTKVLLQLQHQQFVPSLHAERTNPRIDFAASPFYLQRELSDWSPVTLVEDGRAHVYPRRAGISSFGAGGSNAHVIIEEPSGLPSDVRGEERGDQLVILSARNEERLREHCRRIAAGLRHSGEDLRLSEVAYQLQVRREPMEERLAIIASDLEGVCDDLEAFANGGRLKGRTWRNSVRGKKKAAGAPADGDLAVAEAFARRDWVALASHWTAGVTIEWESLYAAPLRHVSLPNYPFAAEPYWIPRLPDQRTLDTFSSATRREAIHPFIGDGGTAGETTRFSVEFTGEEFFLADHFVDEDRIFPAVGYLEMARAGQAALGRSAWRLRSNVWPSAIVVAASRRISIDLVAGTGGSDYEIYSVGVDGGRTLHGRGKVDVDDATSPRRSEEVLDLAAIGARCRHSVSAGDFYRRIHALGLRLGKSYQGIRELRLGDKEALSEIRLPDHLRSSLTDYVLHPSIMDSALQGSLGLIDHAERLQRLFIPFTIGAVEIFGPTPAQCFAHVILQTSTPAGKKLEVRIADADGHVVIRIRDFWLRPWLRTEASPVPVTAPIPGVFFRPAWVPSGLRAAGVNSAASSLLIFASSPAAGQQITTAVDRRDSATRRQPMVVIGGAAFSASRASIHVVRPASGADFEALLRAVPSGGSRDIVYAWPRRAFTAREEDVQAALNEGLFPLFHLMRALARSSDKGRVRVLCVFPGDAGDPQPCYEALGAFFRSVSRESPRLAHRLLELPRVEFEALGTERVNQAANVIADELQDTWEPAAEVRYRNGHRAVKRWREFSLGPDGNVPALRPRGVYIVTGGSHGLGALFSRFAASRVGARLVLSGRSAPDARVEAVLRDVRAAGGEALYVRADVTHAEETSALVQTAKSAFGPINGIVHCAGVIRDAFLVNKDETSVREVLAPKVLGAIHLDRAAQHESLDWLALFSSMAAVTGSIGQTDYAFANGFLDAFVEWREDLRRAGRRSGKTISVNWPLWRDGGMRVDEATEESLHLTFGLRPLETSVGLAALEAMLGAEAGPTLFVPGDGARTRELLRRPEDHGAATEGGAVLDAPNRVVTVAPAPRLTDAASGADIAGALQAAIISLVAALQKIDARRVDAARALAEYGFDSIGFTRLANEINRSFGVDITPALFFEYTTVEAVADVLLKEQPERIAATLSRSQPNGSLAPPPANDAITEAATTPPPSSAGAADASREALQWRLVQEVAALFKLDPSRVDPESELGAYGMDSIAFTRLANRLDKAMGLDLTPATFFEYTTIRALTDHVLQIAPGLVTAPPAKGDLVFSEAASPLPTASRSDSRGQATAAEGSAGSLHSAATPAAHSLPSTPAPRGGLFREPIAIVGMHGVMPQSEDLAEFWNHLDSGRDLITEIPADRWDWREYLGDPLKEPNKTNSKWGGFLREIDKFDARFFGISPREAELMDPQQRLFLETAYKAIEEAGYKPSDLSRGRTGVFVGVGSHDYHELLREADVPIEAYTTTGLFHAILANRVSYLLNLAGPSFPIDTACSSSLVALRSSVEALWSGACDVAIVGGINLLISPMIYISFARAGMLSPDGRCKTFDKSANGYVRAEGAGALVLKPLSKAIADRDHVHAIVRGSAVNHGGRVNTLTTPNPRAQAELIVRAFEEGGVDPATVAYMEVHGTGTSLGDPIEINGLKKAFRELRQNAGQPELTEARCALGSVKTNVGHLEAAAGMAGIFKVILAMKHGRLPGNLHLTELNPYIQLAGSPFRLVEAGESWPRFVDDDGRALPRRAGVSSFGFGGVNGHVLLEAYTAPAPVASVDTGERLYVLSARTDERLREYARRLAQFLEAEGTPGRTEDELVAAAADVLGLGVAEIFLDEPFEDLGFDAVTLDRFWNRIGTAYNIARNPIEELGCRSLAALARRLDAKSASQGRERTVAGGDAIALRLEDVAYTLQVGREPMEHRLAVVAVSAAELVRQLRAFASNGGAAENVFCGQVDDTRVGPAVATTTADQQTGTADRALTRGELPRLAQMWVAGASIDWKRLYPGATPHRVSLPTYPFARTRHWIPQSRERGRVAASRPLHPLLDRLVADASMDEGLAFKKLLAPGDVIIGEHRIHGRAVLPGVAHLEMARAALAMAHDGPFHLANVVWREALEVEEPGRELVVRLRKVTGRIAYQIQGRKNGTTVTYSEGDSMPVSPSEPSAPAPDQAVDAIRTRCPRHVAAPSVYERFRAMGIDYGPYFQGIREVWVGDGEALARVAIRDGDRGQLATYTLHPTLMDAALQAISAISFHSATAPARIRLPFSAEAVELVRPLFATGYAHVRALAPDRFDVTLLDEMGRPCVVLREVSVRAEKDPLGRFFFTPRWEPAPLNASPDTARATGGGCLIVHPRDCFGLDREIAGHHQGERVWRVMLGSQTRRLGHEGWEVGEADVDALTACLRDAGPIRSVYFLAGLSAAVPDAEGENALSVAGERGAMLLFRLVKALGAADLIQGVTTLRVIINGLHDVGGRRPANLGAAAILGLSKSLAKEYPQLTVSCLDIDTPAGSDLSDAQRSAILDAILAEPAHRTGDEVALSGGHRYRKRLRPIRLDRPACSAFRTGGTYLIVGGAGGIGLVLARYLAETAQARLVLVGRRPETQEIADALASIAAKGGTAVYRQADVTDHVRMGEVVDQTTNEFGAIHGVVHAAMVLRDGIVERLDEPTFRSVLAPKVEGSAVLGALFRHRRLDFMLFLSSVQSFTGSAGQGNYAAASLFEDSFARALAGRVSFPVKVVNWGFWGTVGRVASETYAKRLEARGFHSITPEEGMEAIERILASDERQVIAIKAEQSVLAEIGADSPDAAATGIGPAAGAALQVLLHESLPPPVTSHEDEGTAFDTFIGHALLHRLQGMGVLRRPGERYGRDELAQRLGAIPKYRRLIRGLVQILARHHLVAEAGGDVVASDGIGSDELVPALERLPAREAELPSAFPNIAARLRLVSICLQSLPDVLAGRVLATEVMFPKSSVDLLSDIYRGERLVDYCNDIVARSVRSLVQARLRAVSPGTKIRLLEIGAGTGATTVSVIEALREFQGTVTYDFTDLSMRFLKDAERSFGNRLPGIAFRTLDIERPFEAQGFAAHTYDLVMASNVMHATADLDGALERVRRLLKEGGRLVLNEVTRIQDFHTVTFGLLDGWWTHEDEGGRLESSPLLDVEMWKGRLAAVGFDRVAVLGKSDGGRELPQRVIVAEAGAGTVLAAPAPAVTREPVMMPAPIRREQTVHQVMASNGGNAMVSARVDEDRAETLRQLMALITDTAAACLNMAAGELDPDRPLSSFGVDSIVGVELISRINQALDIVLKTIAIFDYPTVRQLAAHIASSHAAVVAARATASGSAEAAPAPDSRAGTPLPSTASAPGSAGGQDLRRRIEENIVDCVSAALGMSAGEVDRRRAFSAVGVDSIVGVEIINRLNSTLGVVLKTIAIFDYPSVEALAEFIVEKYSEKLSTPVVQGNAARARMDDPDRERIHIPSPRRTESGPGGRVDTSVVSAAPIRPAATAGRCQAVMFDRPGSPRHLRIISIEPREPEAGEVEILVRAFPINFSDFLLAKGLYPMMPEFPFTPGVEVSGVISRVGPGVTRVAPGDEVIGLTRPEMGGQASAVITDETFVVKKPEGLSHAEACGFPVAFLAMYLAFERAQVKKGESVLIQAATGTNGLIAVQLARDFGAEIYATAGSRRKIEFLEQMGVRNAINYREVDFSQEIMRRTRNAGVDVVINTLGGDAMQKGLDILAPDGRYVEMAVFGLQASKSVNLSRLVNNQSFYSFNTKKFFVKHPEERVRYLEIMASYLRSGKVKPTVSQVFPFERVQEAYAAKEDRETIGRVVVSLESNAPAAAQQVPVIIPSASAARTMDIAVIGMSGRFPGAENVDQLWELLAEGRSAVSEVPASRWASARYFDPDPECLDKTYCKSGGFLDDVDKFDASFFNISGKEAAQTDPQQRLFLEEAQSALENAGYTSRALDGVRCGVFVGAGPSDYLTRMNKAQVVREAQSFWGNEASVLAARISYFLNLKGPSVAVNTACSSSLVALHLACQSIVVGDSDLALAGGVFLSLAPDYFIVASNGNMLSPEGRCKTFDDSADGFGPGEAVGVLVLKPLRRALDDGDYIHGVIKGSAINQDGKTNGITAPSSLSQTAVELAVYEGFGIPPETISYVEAHGTGTRLGDPIEVDALTNAFQKHTARKQFCAIGSIKTNIGHTAAAAGVSGVIKVLASFKHRQLPASLNFQKPNRYIDFENSPFFVNTALREWKTTAGVPRRAAVSSFGFSGTNAHVVLEEPPASAPATLRPRAAHMVPLSAASPIALRSRIRRLLDWLDRETHDSVGEISYNLQVYRDQFPNRALFVVRDVDELRRRLRATLSGNGQAVDQTATAPLDGPQSEAASQWLAGQAVEWERLYPGERCACIPMPTYPFERERHWYAAEDTVYAEKQPEGTGRIEFRALASGSGDGESGQQTTLSGREFFLDDHRVDGEKMLPGAMYMELACRAAEATGFPVGAIRNLLWLRPLVVNGQPVELTARLRAVDSRLDFELTSLVPGTAEVVHATGTLLSPSSVAVTEHVDLVRIRRNCPRVIDRDAQYQDFRARGLVHGPALAALEELRAGNGQALARLRLPATVGHTLRSFRLHPSLIDGALQVLGALEGRPNGAAPERLLPFSVEEVFLGGELPAECYAYATLAPSAWAGSVRRYHIQLTDDAGRVLVGLRNFAIKGPSSVTNAPRKGAHCDLLTVLRQLESGAINEKEASRLVEVIGGE